MTSAGMSDIQRILADTMAKRPYSHRQDVDSSIAAVVTVESDLRFFPETMESLLRQTVLPGVIVVADCTGGTSQPVLSSFEVIPTPSGALDSVPAPRTVTVEVVRAKGARSFYDAVAKALDYARLDSSTRAIWLLHDDSRPADEHCLESLLETWHNDPTASVLGAKQLDWQAQHLHEVGAYAYHHRTQSLVVDGEPDQEQYDGRRDVFCVAFAGALVSVETLHELDGADDWFTTFGESRDFCRRVCLSGRRVVIVPSARIAHRRARFEGVRNRAGEPLDEAELSGSVRARVRANRRYRITDQRMLLWPLLWVLSLFAACAKTVSLLFAKRPFEALCELVSPWAAIAEVPRAMAARRRVSRQGSVPISRLSSLVASRQQVVQWRDRVRAFSDQRHVTLLSPLAKAHLRRRALERWGLAGLMAFICLGFVCWLESGALRAGLAGGSLYSDALLPSAGDFVSLWRSATMTWVYGESVAAPPTPWLLVWLVASLVSGGNITAAISMMIIAAAPLAALSCWAFIGVFTRSDAVRVSGGLLWASVAVAMGLFATGDVAMLTVMTFLPAAFAFAFRAVGFYHTEDQVRAHPSAQAGALAALCFIPPVAAEPQLIIALLLVFVAFLIVIPRHRAMLLLIPLPSGLVIGPTLVNAVHHASQGAWRQLMGDIMLPSSSANGAPASADVVTLTLRTLGVHANQGWWSIIGFTDPQATGMMIMLLALAALAVASLFLPFALRASRMMWVVIVSGMLLAMVSARTVVAVDDAGPVAGSAKPGIALVILGLIACSALVSGMAVRRFTLLRKSRTAQPASAMQPTAFTTASDITASDITASDIATSAVETTEQSGRTAGHTARTVLPKLGRSILVLLLTASSAFCAATPLINGTGQGSLNATRNGLPMVASDYLAKDPGHRILALGASSSTQIRYTTLRSGRGDLLDSSPAVRAREASSGTANRDAILASAGSRLMGSADTQAISDISALGYGGIFVVRDDTDSAASQAVEQLISNITASEGVQSVVSNADGVYYRLTRNDNASQRVDDHGLDEQRNNPYRLAWLWCLGIIVLLYCIVAFPRSTRRIIEENQ